MNSQATDTTSSLFEQATTPLCRRPVFIIGSPRSGTSILAWALAQHSEFWVSEESSIFFNLLKHGTIEKAFNYATTRPEADWICENKISLNELMEFLGGGLNALFSKQSYPRRWIDQTPLNTHVAESLAKLFPEALFVHILRDGRRVVQSMLNFQNLLTPEIIALKIQKGTMPRFTRSISTASQAWRSNVQLALQFEAKYPNRCIRIWNEELTTNAESAFERLFDFLGAKYESAAADFVKNNRINSSFPNQAHPLESPWLSWSKEQYQEFLAEAGELSVQLGFIDKSELMSVANKQNRLFKKSHFFSNRILSFFSNIHLKRNTESNT